MKTCNVACSACPFRRTALKGYLGGYDGPKEFMHQHYTLEGVNPCHVTIDYNDDDWLDKWQRGEMGKACRGQQIMFVNGHKRPRHWKIDPSVVADAAFFAFPREFIAHHGGPDTDDWRRVQARIRERGLG